MESYLREKKDAILEDRKHFGDLKVILSGGGNAAAASGREGDIDED